MSSSKIQEYNLDPNMGLAKEETSQEILSAVTAVSLGTSVVKSIQRTECDISTRNANTTLNITPVDTSHSFVIMDQYSHISQTYTVRYTLNSDTLYVETSSDYTQTIKLGFWIIEFY